MRVWMKGTSDDMVPFVATVAQGTCVGIRDAVKEVVIECQDLTHTVLIQCSFAELERVLAFCKAGRPKSSLVWTVELDSERPGTSQYGRDWNARAVLAEAIESWLRGSDAQNVA